MYKLYLIISNILRNSVSESIYFIISLEKKLTLELLDIKDFNISK